MLTLRNTTNYELRQIIPNNMQSMDNNCPYGTYREGGESENKTT